MNARHPRTLCLLLFAALALAAAASLRAQTLPSTLWVNQYKSKKSSTAVATAYLDSITFGLGRAGLLDTLRFRMTDGTTMDFRVNQTDSISLTEPRDLLLKELSYYDDASHGLLPTYADDYSRLASWSSRSQWNLANVHDPTVMRAADGWYYMYQTDASYGNAHEGHGHFHCRRSQDLVHWEYLGATLTVDVPSWLLPKVNELRASVGQPAVTALTGLGYWAPVVRRIRDDLYRMYYCIVSDQWNVMGLMETADPASNRWTDRGYVLCSSSDKAASAFGTGSQWGGWYRFNAIDPSYVVTPDGDHWLIYGSWHNGIVALQVDAESGLPIDNLGVPYSIGTGADTRYGRRIATRDAASRWQGSEGPEIVYNPATGYYYLFLAYDELSVAYNTRVARSRSVTGPYKGMNGTDITAGGDCYPVVTHPYRFAPQTAADSISGWVGISHCAVWDDGQGNWFYASQGRLPEGARGNAYSNAIMMGHVRRILWTDNGWPVVLPERYGAVPQPSITADELLGDWEAITLTYSYQKQRTGNTLTLNADGTARGTVFNGTWTYDADRQTLRLGTTYSLVVTRELDWEASPRHATIVIAGYNVNGTRTLWGKKVTQ